MQEEAWQQTHATQLRTCKQRTGGVNDDIYDEAAAIPNANSAAGTNECLRSQNEVIGRE